MEKPRSQHRRKVIVVPSNMDLPAAEPTPKTLPAAWESFTGPNTIVISFNGSDEPLKNVHGDLRCFSQINSPMMSQYPVFDTMHKRTKFRPKAKRSSLGNQAITPYPGLQDLERNT